MNIVPLYPNFKIPTKSRELSGGYDLYMPVAGEATSIKPTRVSLGFAAEIPQGYVGLILPRSGVGVNQGLSLNNTCGVIDADYRGEWVAHIRTKYPVESFTWEKGDRLLQVLFVPVASFEFKIVNQLNETERGTEGFGSSGN